MIRILTPAITLLLVVAVHLGLGGWNRAAPPRQVLEVTERELSLPIGAEDATREGETLRLELTVDHRYDALDARNWLPEDRLRALGFTISVPAGAPEAADTYRRTPPRLGWVALEYDGPAFVEIERRRALNRERYGPWRGQSEPSRLIPVDAGPDFEPLRARYPAGHLIVRAVIGLSYLAPSEGGPMVHGMVRDVIPAHVTVPRHLRADLRGLPARLVSAPDGPHTLAPPRYAAELASGPLGVLYLRSVRRIE